MKKITLLILLAVSYVSFAQPGSAPPAPTQMQADVVSVFSDAYTDAATMSLASFTPAGNTATISNQAGNDVYEFMYMVDNAGGEFVGFSLSNAIDLSTMEFIHYDIWIGGTTDVGAVFNTTVSQHGAGHLTGQTQGYVQTNPVGQGQEGQWLSFDFAFNTFGPDLSGMAPKNIVSELVFTIGSVSDGAPVYVDNIYFWRNPIDPNQDATLSDLTVDGTTVENFSSGVFDYNVTVPNGTTMVPTVGATASQGSSMVNINDATGIPGTTTVTVTAPDGTTTQDYTVIFEEVGIEPPTTDSPEQGSTGTDLIVYSGLSGDDTVTNFNFNTFSGNGVAVSEVDIESNGNLAGLLAADPSAFWFYGAQWDAEDLVAGGYQYVHLNYYATNSTEFNFFLIDATAGIGGGAPEEPRYRFGGPTPDAAIIAGSWQSVFIPLSHFTNFPTGTFSYDLNDIFQYKFDGNGTVYFDNIYFSTTNTLGTNSFEQSSITAYPNPSKDAWNVSVVNSSIQTVEVFNTLGQSVKTIIVNDNNVRIDASDLATGLYFAKIQNERNQFNTIKLVKN